MWGLGVIEARRELISKQPLYQFLGLRFNEVKRGWAQFSQTPEPRFIQPSGIVHPGALLTGADAALGAVGWAELSREGQAAVTDNLKASFLRAAEESDGPFLHSATLLDPRQNFGVQSGDTVWAECKTVNRFGDLVMHSTGAFAVVDFNASSNDKKRSQPELQQSSASSLDGFLGYEFQSAAAGRAVIHQPLNLQLNNGLGALHGGMTLSLLHTVGEKAALSDLPPETPLVVASCDAHFLRPGSQGEQSLKAIAEVDNKSKRSVLVRSRLENPEGKLIASATYQYAILVAG